MVDNSRKVKLILSSNNFFKLLLTYYLTCGTLGSTKFDKEVNGCSNIRRIIHPTTVCRCRSMPKTSLTCSAFPSATRTIYCIARIFRLSISVSAWSSPAIASSPGSISRSAVKAWVSSRRSTPRREAPTKARETRLIQHIKYTIMWNHI